LLLTICAAALASAIVFPSGCPLDRLLTSEIDRKAQVSQQVAGIVNAIKLYESYYSIQPVGGESDHVNIPTDHVLIDILSGHNESENPSSITFNEGRSAKPAKGRRPAHSGFIDLGDGSQSLVGPWGNPYFVRLDGDDDGHIKDPSSDREIRSEVLCWSYGEADDRNDRASAVQTDPKDWITSWH
jgi:hypothetical protein